MTNLDIAWGLDGLRVRQLDYATANAYYRGEHRLAFATEKFRNAFGSLLKANADNLCPAVVDTVSDRLQVAGFATDDDDKAVNAATTALWRANRMDRRSGEVHAEALRTGDAYLLIWPDADGAPRFYPQAGHLCYVEYDEDLPGQITKAVKVWHDLSKRWRLNLYYADRIEKYTTQPTESVEFPGSASAFLPLEVPGETWPLSNPWGRVPMFHFANNVSTGQLGRSELADVIPLQDGLNKSLADMLVAMEFIALPQRWITGIETEIDETTGKPKALFVPGADRIWTVGAPDARMGQFEAANLTQFIAVQEAFRVEIARVSRTPLHHLMPTASAFPSGEAMKTAEQPLLAKIKDRQIGWGNVWEDALTFALALSGVTLTSPLSCNWQDSAPRNEEALLASLLLKKQLGVSQAQLLREAGYSDEQIAAFAVERQADQIAIGEQLLTAFDRGQANENV